MFSNGNFSISYKEILDKISEIDMLAYYFNINKLPIVINSPLRTDNNPSFGLKAYKDFVYYTDFATGEKGNFITLLIKYWNTDYQKVLTKIYNDIPKITKTNITTSHNSSRVKKANSTTILKIKIRAWRDYDINYWQSYGISLSWLQFANVYPISNYILTKDNKDFVFYADKYAYAYIEYKDKIVSIKVYQPFNVNGYKWINKHDKSVISLWTKVPDKGDKICICSSTKDALCLMCNTGIPAISLQGEGYLMSNSVVKNLKQRYNKIYVLYDNDSAGIKGGQKLSNQHGFINIVLPKINNTKDISDLYKSLQDKKEFNNIMLNLFKDE